MTTHASPGERRGADAPDEVLATCKRGDGREELRVTLREFKGFKFLDVRVWYRPEGGDEMRPGKGTTIKARELRHVARAIGAAIANLDPGNGR
jgi:hypothetical protein